MATAEELYAAYDCLKDGTSDEVKILEAFHVVLNAAKHKDVRFRTLAVGFVANFADKVIPAATDAASVYCELLRDENEKVSCVVGHGRVLTSVHG